MGQNDDSSNDGQNGGGKGPDPGISDLAYRWALYHSFSLPHEKVEQPWPSQLSHIPYLYICFFLPG